MKKLNFIATVISSLILGVLSNFTGDVYAKPLKSSKEVKVSQVNDVLSPSSTSNPQYIGIVSKVNAQEVGLRLSDGSSRTFAINTSSPRVLSIGETITFGTNDKGEIDFISSDSTHQKIEGQLVDFTDNGIEVLVKDGSRRDIPVSSKTQAELNLAYGDQIQITMFDNIPGAVGICKIKTASFTPEKSEPFKTPAPINGLW